MTCSIKRCGENKFSKFPKWPNGMLCVILLLESKAILFKILGIYFNTSNLKKDISLPENAFSDNNEQ